MPTSPTLLTIAASLTACLVASAPLPAFAQDATPPSWQSLEGRRPPQPPPGFGLSGVPAGYYGGPRLAGAPNTTWEEPIGAMRRDKKTAGVGGAVMGTGFLTLIAGLVVLGENTECKAVLLIFPACHQKDAGVQQAAHGMMIGGAVTLLVGIPILVSGLRKRPVAASTASLAGHPTPGGWGWSF